MKANPLLKYMLLLSTLILVVSCEFEDFPVETETFGVRHDVDLTEYENLGQNRGEYFPGPDYPDFSAVCAVSYIRDDEPIDGSGVLIDEFWVLTAAHNLLNGNEEFLDPQTSSLTASFGDDFSQPEGQISVIEAYLHPGWEANQGEGREAAVDIALLRLSESAAEWAIMPYPELPVESVGIKIFVCGFGDYSEQIHDGELYSQKHAFENILDRLTREMVLNYEYSGDDLYLGGLMACDFDSPLEYSNALDPESIESSNEEVRALGPGDSSPDPLPLEGTTVPGDSGGPAFAKINGKWKVIGIVSSGSTDSNYGDVGIFTRVSSHRNWIESVIR